MTRRRFLAALARDAARLARAMGRLSLVLALLALACSQRASPDASAPRPTRPAPAAPATPTPAAPSPSAAAGALQIEQWAFARAVANHAAVGTETPFTTADERVYLFLTARNRGAAPANLVVTFTRPNGQVLGTPARLEVGAVRSVWHTWAFARVQRLVGTWTATVADEAGAELLRQTFEVVAAPPGAPDASTP